MGRKKKPTKTTKLFEKRNNRIFTLVFLKPSLDERSFVVSKSKFQALIAENQLQLTTPLYERLDAKLVDQDDASVGSFEDDVLLYDSDVRDDDDDDDEEEEEDFDGDDAIMLEVTKQDSNQFLLVDISSNGDPMQAANVQEEQPTTTTIDIELGAKKRINLNRLLAILTTVNKLKKCEKEKVSFKNDYQIRFNINFELNESLSYWNFSQLLKNLARLLRYEKSGKFIVEIPFEIITRLMKYMTDRQMDANVFRISISSFAIGTMLNLSKFISHYQIEPKAEITPMLLKLNFQQRTMSIYFFLDNQRAHNLFYNFSLIRLIVLEQHEHYYRVYFECTDAPALYFTDLDSKNRELLQEVDICDMRLSWYRSIKFRPIAKLGQARNESNQKKTDINMLGMSKTFCIQVPSQDGDDFLAKLFNLAYICRERNKIFQFYLSNVMHEQCTDLTYDDLKSQLYQREFPFRIHFACLVLFSSSYKVLDALQRDDRLKTFIEMIQFEVNTWKDEKNLEYLEHCLYHLKVQSREHVIIDIFQEFVKLLSRRKEIPREVLHDDYVLIRKATLYPSHLELQQPVALLKSRFSNLANLEYAIRMTIWDDNGRMLNRSGNLNENDFIMDMIKPQLLDGIKIADRVYEFLGSSTSQMRDFGCTLYCIDIAGRNADDIRNAVGKLSVFKRNVPKYIARFGLVFSQSMTIIEMGVDVEIRYTPDILGKVKPDCRNYTNLKEEQYVLSDGIGLVAHSVAQTFIPYLDLKSNYFPSAYQIRFGGCKGMLTVWNLPYHQIIFRESMKKYESDSRMLGILKYSWPRWVYLNRPLIAILDHLNVDRDELYHYYYHSTASVAKATIYDSCAMDLIRIYATGLLPYDNIHNSSISLLDEPFLRSIINYLIYYRLNFELKLKTRIRVPNHIGRIAFGVIDESKSLEYGQVYFQYTKMTQDGTLLQETIVHIGPIIVTKFPCLQPGDVRKFIAVDVKELSHIKDCLVFPQNGDRPHPDEMGGSDLDGDEYAIFWDTLDFPGDNRKPLDFPYGLSRSLQNDITSNDLIDFFCKYLVKTNIGQVANTHLLFADFHHEGLDSKECEELAFTYNISLDFPKTGVIEFTPRKYRVFIRPDFMARNSHDKVYLSKKMLGEFYRHCSLIERIIELSQYDYRFAMFNPGERIKKKKNFDTKKFKSDKSLIKNRLILPEWKMFHKEAEEAFFEYKLKVVNIMEQLEVENEVMLFADVYEEKKEACKSLLNNLFDYFQKKFHKQCETNRCENTIERYYLASAWYAICYEQNFFYNGKPLLGMPWIISKEMQHLALFNFSGKIATKELLAENVRTMIVDGERLTLTLGVNHKEVVPYVAENAFVHGMLFDYQTKNVFNTDVVHFYWCPVEVVRLLQRQCPHLLPLHHEMIENIQLNIVHSLIMHWIVTIKERIYFDRINDRTIVIHGQDEIGERELLQRIVKKRLLQIWKNCGRKANLADESLPTISTMFNQFMFYLFEVCNRINAAIYHADLEELFLLKYAVFALSFVNKLDSKLDRKFCISFALDYHLDDQNGMIYILQMLYDRRQADYGKQSLKIMFPPSEFVQVDMYHTFMDSLFDTYLADNNCLVEDAAKFNLLPTEGRVALDQVDELLIPKLLFLSNVRDIQITLSKEDPMPYMNDEQTQTKAKALFDAQRSSSTLMENTEDEPPETTFSTFDTRFDRCKTTTDSKQTKKNATKDTNEQTNEELAIAHYFVKTSGLVHCTQILRLLIGHCNFFEKICFSFDVKQEDKEDSGGDDHHRVDNAYASLFD